MSEFLFVLKTLLITAAITLLMQVHIAGSTIESRADRLLTKSSVAIWLQTAASGGALALKNVGHSVKDAVSKTAEGIDETTAHVEHAGR